MGYYTLTFYKETIARLSLFAREFEKFHLGHLNIICSQTKLDQT